MKIGLAGTVSVGKSTLVKELAKLEQFKDYHIATERSKYLRDQGVTLNDDSTTKGQFIFAAERSLELMHDNLLTDRTIYDVCAFTLSAKSISYGDKIKLIESFVTIKDDYDVVIYVSPKNMPIEDNNIRTTDTEYRMKIDFAIRGLLKEYPPKKLIEIEEGTVENRVKLVISNLFGETV
jgi:deoxyadenosine/deoxycytidine kinase